MHAAEGLHHGGHAGFDLRVIGQVERAELNTLGVAGRHACTAFAVHVEHHYLGTGRHQAVDHRLADQGGAAGDDGHLAVHCLHD